MQKLPMRLGTQEEALAKLNIVRKRAGLPDALSAGQADMAHGLSGKKEEWNWPWKHDSFLGPGTARARRAGDACTWKRIFVDGKNELFPIPQEQILLSGGRFETEILITINSLMRPYIIHPAYRHRFTGDRTKKKQIPRPQLGGLCFAHPRTAEDL